MTHLQKITSKAKQIRKAKPNMKWTDAIKQASKELKKVGGLVGVHKGKSDTIVKYTRKKPRTVKKVTQPKLFGTKTHKDTKSHNVNIRVLSGTFSMRQIEQLQKRIDSNIKTIDSVRTHLRRKGIPTIDANRLKSHVKDLSKENSEFKKVITLLKKTF